jgi:Holliday junction resolvasome RuvABC endonuclease subunit
MGNLIAIDYSMSCPGICIYKDTFEASKFYFFNKNKKLAQKWLGGQIIGTLDEQNYKSEEHRWDVISNWAMGIIRNNDPEHVVMEGYAYGSSAGMVFNIAENTGVLKHKIYKDGISLSVIAPTQVKKIFTGKGNSNKDAMYSTAREKFDFPDLLTLFSSKKVGNPISDLVDAFAIGYTFKNQS